MIAKGMSVVQVNSYIVRHAKEAGDNNHLKDNTKNSKMIANLYMIAILDISSGKTICRTTLVVDVTETVK